MLPGSDFYDPYYVSPEFEAECLAALQEAEAEFRSVIAEALAQRGDLYTQTVREIVIDELNKVNPLAGEPA